MATRMRTWGFGVGVSCAVLATWLIPPEPWDAFLVTRREQTSERQEERRVASEIRMLSGKLKRLRTGEYLEREIATSPDRASGLVVGLPEALSEETKETIRGAVREAFEPWDSPESSVVVGMFALPQSFGNYGGGEATFYPGGELFVDAESEVPYCARVLPYRGADQLNNPQAVRVLASDFSDLGTCVYYARFGAPGPQIGSWLRDQGFFLFATTARDVPDDWWDRYRPERDPFGMTSFRGGWGGQSAHGWGCFAATDEACRRALGLDGTRRSDWFSSRYEEYREVSSWASTSALYRATAFGSLDRAIFHTLRTEFGDEAFGAFWTSEKTVEAAFEVAFGLSFVDWVQQWILRGEEPIEAGPGLPPRDTLLSLLTIAAMLAVAGAVAQTRKVV